MTRPSHPIYKHVPFILLILAQLAFGLFTFRDYGLAWDEPLFYDYGDALGYAYAPANWFAPDFDLNRAYGPSGDDHKNRGPAYLVLARGPARLLQSLGLERASAWHLVNFLTFLLGVWFVYRLSLRWMSAWAAFGAALLFSTQPLLWGHAFINPKDMPFLVFFTGALLFGFEMVDGLTDTIHEFNTNKRMGIQPIGRTLLAAFFLGIATSTRVLAPLAGILVIIYAITQYALRNTQHEVRNIRTFILHLSSFILLSLLFMLASWPYLWEAPLKNFLQVFLFMSENPTGLQVLFNGEIYRAFELPRRYLPTFLALTLTEPVWPLFLLGLGFALWKSLVSIYSKNTPHSTSAPITNYQLPITDYWLLITAFLIPSLYVLLLQPPMYDGFRHFLFILPPVFVTCGLGLEVVFGWMRKWEGMRVFNWLRAIAILLLAFPGFLGMARLHPYEYTYYNSLIGGTGGAFRVYETDYWLTCYKEAVEQANALAPAALYVHREAYIAAAYAAPGLAVLEERGNLKNIRPGDLILVNTRTNEDRKTFRDAPILVQVGRGGAVFCVVKQVP